MGTVHFYSNMEGCKFAVILFSLGVTCCFAQLKPPRYEPGDVIKPTDFETVDGALDDVLRAGSVLEGRRCAIGISNLDMERDLTNPAWYVDYGKMFSSAPYTIPAGRTGLNLFIKREVYIFGTIGIMSYDITGTDYKLVVLWRVPWNTLLYDVLYNVKIYPSHHPTDKAMFDQMMAYSGNKVASGWMEKNEYGIKVLATISQNTNAKLYVSVDASQYNPSNGPQLHGECSKNHLNPLWWGEYCWKECVPKGYCWVNKKCSSDADCAGPMSCYDNCKKS